MGVSTTRTHGHHAPPRCNHKLYRLSCDEFDALHAEAASRCQMCSTEKAYLLIDHDHAVGIWAVRGLICGRCNAELRDAQRDKRPVSDRAAAFLATPWHAVHRVNYRPRAGHPNPTKRQGWQPSTHRHVLFAR